MTLTTLVLVTAGLAALTGGADALVRGASRLALLLGLSPLVVGLTVVAFGTSAPEVAASVAAACSDGISSTRSAAWASGISSITSAASSGLRRPKRRSCSGSVSREMALAVSEGLRVSIKCVNSALFLEATSPLSVSQGGVELISFLKPFEHHSVS